jgi:hypothetical protein
MLTIINLVVCAYVLTMQQQLSLLPLERTDVDGTSARVASIKGQKNIVPSSPQGLPICPALMWFADAD